MRINERYDAKRPLSVTYAPYLTFWLSEKVIEQGHQNFQNVRFLGKIEKKFKIFFM